MKGIILAGGTGSRLYPITSSVSKQLLPIYDKPMIYYPLTTLMQMNIRQILIISSNEYIDQYKKLLGDGSRIGINIKYEIQNKPNGIADAFLVGEKFINNNRIALILGDNIFYGNDLNPDIIKKFDQGGKIFLYKVNNPSQYGVAEIKNKKILKIIEKPKKTNSKFAVTGIYLYDKKVLDLVKTLKPSKRNEIEITDLNNLYLNKKELSYKIFSRGTVWLDAGTHSSLLQTSEFVKTIQDRQKIFIACPEQIALEKKWISIKEFKKLSAYNYKNDYGDYLRSLIE